MQQNGHQWVYPSHICIRNEVFSKQYKVCFIYNVIMVLFCSYLTNNGGLPRLKHLDLSGCPNLEGEAVVTLVKTAVHLDPAHLFYCDNILDGPYADTASGCQNLQCGSRVCCRCGE